jgi:hypothetical protein
MHRFMHTRCGPGSAFLQRWALHHSGHDEVDAGKAEAGSTPAAKVAATAIKNTRVIWLVLLFQELGVRSI